MAQKTIGCIGKCTSGLSLDDISRITQNIDQTLRDPVGRRILRKYLIRGGRRDGPKCLDFYERCSNVVAKEESCASSTNRASEDFTNEFDEAMYEAAELHEISEITFALLERLGEARDSQNRDLMLDVLKDAMTSASDHLRKSHPAFSLYVQQPCPRNK